MAKPKITDVKVAEDALHYEYAFNTGVNFRHRIIQITGDIQPPLFDYVDAALTEMERENRKGITIKIHSFGGSAYEALAIIGRIKRSSCFITTEGYGAIMSAAALILACGDRRKISQYSWYMWHESSYVVEGKHSEIKNTVIQTEREEEQWAQAMAKFSHKDTKFWRDVGKHTDAYFSPQELVDMGVCDDIF